MSNSEVVSRILNGLKSLNKDNRISKRYILKVAQEKAKFLLSQKSGSAELYREDNVYTTLKCLELEKVDIIKCGIIEFRSCKQLMKSKKKLPELIYSKLGSSVKQAISLDGMIELKPTTPTQYRLNRQRKTSNNTLYFYVQDGYLYIPDSEVESLELVLIAQDLYDLNECSSCKSKDCKSAWEYEFICSDKLLETVIQETIKEVSITKQIQADQNPNLNEGT
jgi:hypothetical protein